MPDNSLIPMIDSKTIDFEELMNQDPTLLKICASREDTPGVVLARLACHKSKEIRAIVARNKNTPQDVLSVLSTDSESLVKRAVSENPSTPASVLRKVVEDDGYGLSNALKNPSTPLESILYRMFSKLSESEKTAIGFNKRFNALIDYAARVDAASLDQTNGGSISADDFGSDGENVLEGRWS